MVIISSLNVRAAVGGRGVEDTTMASGHREGLSAIDFRVVTEGVSDGTAQGKERSPVSFSPRCNTISVFIVSSDGLHRER